MKLTISETHADIGSITFSEKSFGKYLDDEDASYVLVVDVDDFIQRFNSTYSECVAELIRDDEITGKFHPPYAGATSYPSLEELLHLPESLRMEMIDTYFVFDILRLYVGEEISGPSVGWVIKSLDSLSQHGAVLSICGRVIKKV